jgi:flavin reductase (DIM6/NTAB) family NADH-FMN oxidoreductase RutF
VSSGNQQSDPSHNGAVVFEAEFRAACSLFPTGVTVVTRRLADGRPYGMTVSSFTSVSLDPPLVLVCIDRKAAFLHHVQDHMPFAVNVLNEHQQHLASRFADREEEDRFAGVDWKAGPSGIPLLGGAVTSFICTLDRSVEAGDHLILIGAVRDIDRQDGRSLVWCERGYRRLECCENNQGRERIADSSLVNG